MLQPWVPALARAYGLTPADLDLITVAEARMFLADLRKPEGD